MQSEKLRECPYCTKKSIICGIINGTIIEQCLGCYSRIEYHIATGTNVEGFADRAFDTDDVLRNFRWIYINPDPTPSEPLE